uniref:Non-specific protein-tyrosine kinase n=1 Tax=Panagrolaimus sp. PS1159 TaxID=55785 RepID=A0AC35GLK5_9BILA
MEAKNKFLFVESKSFVPAISDVDRNEKYSNLNLKKNSKFSKASNFQSDFKKYSKKQKEKLRAWQKININSKISNFDESEVEKCRKKNGSSNATNNSTLFLHISAYENSNEASSSDSFNKTFQKSWLIQKQLNPDPTFVSQNPFEFQRQQNDKVPVPEVAQFKANQRLSNAASQNAPSKVVIEEHLKKVYAMQLYHGLRSRAHVEETLKEKGDYLFRMIKGRKNEIVLSICLNGGPTTERKFAHIPITYNVGSKRWEHQVLHGIGRGKVKASNRSVMEQMDAGATQKPVEKKAIGFGCLADLVKCYRDYPIYQGVKLKNGKKRPKWLISIGSLKYDTKDLLGNGNFCQVIKGKIRGKPDRVVGIKMLHEDENDTPKSDMEKDEGRDSMFREAHLMSKCNHNHVIKLFGVQCDIPPVMIIMEYCAGGSLDTHLQKEKDDIPLAERLIYCYESCSGMKYLHHWKLIHRDLAARNCLISSNGLIKISDFGLSRATDRSEDDIIIKNGPIRWMAPETLSKRPDFSFKSDVWSFGILCYEIYNEGIKPWIDENDMKKLCHMIKDGHKPILPEKTPKEMKKLINQCWSLTPSERPDFKVLQAAILNLTKETKIPKPFDFSVNRLQGVIREELFPKSIEENEKSNCCAIGGDGDIVQLTTEETGTTVSRDSKGSKDSRDSCEDLTRGIRATKKQHNKSSKKN